MTTQELKSIAQKMFLKACEGWTVNFCTPYKGEKNAFLVVANGHCLQNIPFKVSLDKKGWLVDRIENGEG